MTTARRRLLRDARDPWIVVGLFVLAVVIPGVIATIGGAILVPHNDDFGYRRVATTLFDEGRIQFTGWTVMTLLGQVFFTLPFMWLLGGSAWAFALSAAALVGIGIVASYHLARRLLAPPRATFAVLTVLLIPGVLRNTTTFMTDLPAFAGEMLCLTLGAAALNRTDDQHRWRWLIASLLAGCWAFSIREFALAAPVSVLVVAFLSDPARRVARYAVAFAAVLGAAAVIYFAIGALPGQVDSTTPVFGPDEVGRTIHATSTLAFFLAPAMVLGAATWIPRWRRMTDSGARRRAIVGGVSGIVVAAVLFAGDIALLPHLSGRDHLRTIVGNVFSRGGSPEAQLLAGTRPAVFPFEFWDAIGFLAIVAAFVGFAALGAAIGAGAPRLLRALDVRRRPTELGSVVGLLLVFTAIYGVGIIVFGIVLSMFDRYTWPLVFTISVLAAVASCRDRRTRRATARSIRPASMVGTPVPTGREPDRRGDARVHRNDVRAADAQLHGVRRSPVESRRGRGRARRPADVDRRRIRLAWSTCDHGHGPDQRADPGEQGALHEVLAVVPAVRRRHELSGEMARYGAGREAARGRTRCSCSEAPGGRCTSTGQTILAARGRTGGRDWSKSTADARAVPRGGSSRDRRCGTVGR